MPEEASKLKLLLINGPNLNLLGTREPGFYGTMTLPAIESELQKQADVEGFELLTFQNNHEGGLIDRIQLAPKQDVKGIVINPAGFTHTSVALRDALSAVGLPFVEVHLSNIYQRETFRKHSYLSDIAMGVILGMGWPGYSLALRFLHESLTNRS